MDHVGSIKQLRQERASHMRADVGLSEQGYELLGQVYVMVDESGTPRGLNRTPIKVQIRADAP